MSVSLVVHVSSCVVASMFPFVLRWSHVLCASCSVLLSLVSLLYSAQLFLPRYLHFALLPVVYLNSWFEFLLTPAV